ncbi:SDR family NAD(P)-dependent oxidoreductase [Roseobacter sp. YSTF-M11]|uniref:SDR family NAD(P)-dependent oxidoreductase n=1 Tax=Roseobacter insulae TaxID=2859783 RepID=A0A9X1FS81_9RHOB|nr:SDR family NAD(P)-dependent oxidoreductase [Roseobacter insulae]MBW4706429.1 SDR family NAD(P)-dependent oxidoreductase [Roseobacter insulae]
MQTRTALVTGANGGLGTAIAKGLAIEHHMHVLVAARQMPDARETADALRSAGGEATPIQLDVSSDESVAKLRTTIEQAGGRLDVLVNNAGRNSMTEQSEASLGTVDMKTALGEFDTNALGALRVSQASFELLRKSDAPRVINVSTEMASLSTAATDFYPLAPSYRISKVALNAVTVLLAREWAKHCILVNAYSPGWLRTAMGAPEAPYSADEGAETALWLATLENNGPTGRFFAEMRRMGQPVVLDW